MTRSKVSSKQIATSGWLKNDNPAGDPNSAPRLDRRFGIGHFHHQLVVPLVMQVNNNGFAGIMNIPKHTLYNTELDRHQSPATHNALNPRGV
jgi:hypothetical protein